MSQPQSPTETYKPSQVALAIEYIAKTSRALFIWGPPGIAKSAIARQAADSRGIAFVDIRLSQMDPTDLRGIPFPVNDGTGDGVRWSPPNILPRNIDLETTIDLEAIETTVKFRNPRSPQNKYYYVPKPVVTVTPFDDNLVSDVEIDYDRPDRFTVVLREPSTKNPKTGEIVKGKKVAGRAKYTIVGEAEAVIALDEYNAAPESVQAASYQLILDRLLGEYEVPEKVIMLAMGNRETDKGIAYKMKTPVMNRFVHIEMKSDFDDWQKWALGACVNAEVVGFLSAFKKNLFDFEPSAAARGFPTPRSWTFVSDILNKNDDMNEEVALGLIIGSVGQGAGMEFMGFRRLAADLPKAESILNGSLKDMAGRKVDTALSYALTTTICYELKQRADDNRRKHGKEWNNSPERKRWLTEADNFLEFIMKNFAPEICIMAAKGAIAIHKLPFDTIKMKHFDTFADKYRDLIMS